MYLNIYHKGKPLWKYKAIDHTQRKRLKLQHWWLLNIQFIAATILVLVFIIDSLKLLNVLIVIKVYLILGGVFLLLALDPFAHDWEKFQIPSGEEKVLSKEENSGFSESIQEKSYVFKTIPCVIGLVLIESVGGYDGVTALNGVFYEALAVLNENLILRVGGDCGLLEPALKKKIREEW